MKAIIFLMIIKFKYSLEINDSKISFKYNFVYECFELSFINLSNS